MKTAPLAALFLLACVPEGADDDDTTDEPGFPSELAAELQAALDALVDEVPARGLTASVVLADGTQWTGASGFADPDEDLAMAPDDRFGLASISKTYTAGLVLELVEDGALGLDDTLEAHRPGLHPRGADITVRQLLMHTAGVPEAAGAPEFTAEPEREWTDEELVGFVTDEPLLFEPGSDYAYSNTHYLLLGLVAQAAGGADWRDQMAARLLHPFGLDRTQIPGPGDGWADTVPTWLGDTRWTRRVAPYGIGAAGGLIAEASDVARWARIRFGGHLHSAALNAEQVDSAWGLNGGVSYGLGLLVIEEDDGGTQLAHNGALNGYATWAGYRVDEGVGLAVLANAWSEAGPAGYTYSWTNADALWEAVLAADLP